jgi:predicted RNase H-like HicB family nuclease
MNDIKEIKWVEPPYPFEAYAHIVTPLTKEDGGGYLITFPDLPGCISDGETQEEAIENGRDAFIGWISAAIDMGREVPPPQWQPETVPEAVSGKFIQRVPKTVHAKLVRRAKAEGVSLNSLVLTFIAEGLGKREEKSSKATHRRTA